MQSLIRMPATISLAAALLSPILISGCSPAPTYQDTAHGDSHRWDAHERDFYARWESETHRAHVDFQRRSEAEQREYWDWRHRQ